MIEGKQNVIQYYDQRSNSDPENPVLYWAIYHQGKTDAGNWVAKSSERDGLTKTQGLQELESALSLISYGRFTLNMTASPKITGKGNFRCDFTIPAGGSTSQQQPTTTAIAGVIPEGFVSAADVDKRIENALIKYQVEQEVKRLQALVKEHEGTIKEYEKNDPWTKIAGIAAEYAPMLLGQMTTPGIAGTGTLPAPLESNFVNEEQTETAMLEEIEVTEEENERLVEVIKVFASVDKNWLDTLEKMAAKVKKNPNLLKMIKLSL